MSYLHYFCGLILLAFILTSCEAHKVNSQSTPAPELHPAPPLEESHFETKLISDCFVEEDRLSYNGYEVVKANKKVALDYPSDMKSPTFSVDVSYAVLTRNGKVLAKFDSVYHDAGNATDFGIFSFLGGDTKQLVVAQTIPRGGRHWIVNLSPTFRVIYDSGDYGLGREDMTVVDVDKDGIYEITQELTAFVFFEGITRGATHIIDVLFKYDEKSKRYLPASHIFQDYTLKDTDDLRDGVSLRKYETPAAAVLRMMLPYIYAGKRKDAWKFYEREYTLPNKQELKAKTMAQLEDEAVYKYIYSER